MESAAGGGERPAAGVAALADQDALGSAGRELRVGGDAVRPVEQGGPSGKGGVWVCGGAAARPRLAPHPAENRSGTAQAVNLMAARARRRSPSRQLPGDLARRERARPRMSQGGRTPGKLKETKLAARAAARMVCSLTVRVTSVSRVTPSKCRSLSCGEFTPRINLKRGFQGGLNGGSGDQVASENVESEGLQEVTLATSDLAEFRSLRVWLSRIPGLEVQQTAGVPAPGEQGATDVLTILARTRRLRPGAGT